MVDAINICQVPIEHIHKWATNVPTELRTPIYKWQERIMDWIMGTHKEDGIFYHPHNDPEEDPIARVGDPWLYLYDYTEYELTYDYSKSPWKWLQDPRSKRQRIQEKFIQGFLNEPDKSLLTDSIEK